jgi:predicted transcriptional regulator of viral defense system
LTACKIHGFQVPETNTIYVVTKKGFNVKEFDGWIFKPRFMTDIFGIVKNDKIRYTDYTRTVIEMIRDFDKYMSLIEFLTFLKSVNTLDSNEVNKVLEILDSKIVFQKIGWLIDYGLLNVDKSNYLIEFYLRNIGSSRRLFCKEAKNKGKYNSKWQLVLPKEIKV